MDIETSDIFLFILMAAVLVIIWGWIAWLKWKEKRTWYIWGCLAYAVSYILLVVSNIIGYNVTNCRMPYTFITIVFWGYIIQVGAGISFIVNAYTKDHPNDGVL